MSFAEKASIDEAYLDFTVPVRELILERQPHLAAVPEDAPLGLDTPLPDPPTIDWTALGNIVPILSDDYDDGGEISQEQKDQKVDKPVAAPDKIQPSKSSASAWSDYALSIGAELVQKCRDDVRGQLGYTCSAGVSRNKVCLLRRPACADATHFSASRRSYPSCAALTASRMRRRSCVTKQYQGSFGRSSSRRSAHWAASLATSLLPSTRLQQSAICGKPHCFAHPCDAG